MPRLPYQPGEHTKTLVFPVHWYTAYNTYQEILGYPQSHLRTDHHIEIMAGDILVEFHANKVPGAGYHIMKIGIDIVSHVGMTAV